ncbi:hypothetical protein ACF06P_35815 [Streptomyces sp. NPDC015684]|uniref:hypothetical protein n=1 Tax=Streptomyces sp. NPDC015684 TaxID=3364963 RepID=UPI0036FF462B
MQSSIAYTEIAVPQPTFVPPLDIAREQARQTLDQANSLDLSVIDSFALAREFGGVCEALRQVLAALDAEDSRHA